MKILRIYFWCKKMAQKSNHQCHQCFLKVSLFEVAPSDIASLDFSGYDMQPFIIGETMLMQSG